MNSVFALRNRLKCGQILLNRSCELLSVHQDVRVHRLLEWNDFEFLLLPFLLNGFKDTLIFQLSVCMIYNFSNFFSVVLYMIFSQVNNGKRGWCFEMRCFDQVKNLVPMSLLKGFSSQVFEEFDNEWSLFYLEHYDFVKWSALVLHEIILRKFLLKISIDLIDWTDDFVCV